MRFNFFKNEIAVAAENSGNGDVLVVSSGVCKSGKDPEHTDARWQNNPCLLYTSAFYTRQRIGF